MTFKFSITAHTVYNYLHYIPKYYLEIDIWGYGHFQSEESSCEGKGC